MTTDLSLEYPQRRCEAQVSSMSDGGAGPVRQCSFAAKTLRDGRPVCGTHANRPTITWWANPSTKVELHGAGTSPSSSREILEDRLRGLMSKQDGHEPDEPTELWLDLSWAITRLVAGVARVHPDDAGSATEAIREIVVANVLTRAGELATGRRL